MKIEFVMISMVEPLHAGNALRLFIEPPTGAIEWKILRKGSGTFAGVGDPSALMVYQGGENVIVDTNSLQNGVMAFYCPFYTTDGQTWTPGPVSNGTPNANYAEHTTDVLTDLRQRLEAGLFVECQRGNFQTELGYIQVFIGPVPLDQNQRFPLVSIQMEGEDPSERSLGEMLSADSFDSIGGDWDESEGWLSNVRITVQGVAINSDERNELRKALRRVVLANLPVFEGLGWSQPSLQTHADDNAVNGEFPAPLFITNNTFSCVAPVRVGGPVDAITDVTVTGGFIGL